MKKFICKLYIYLGYTFICKFGLFMRALSYTFICKFGLFMRALNFLLIVCLCYMQGGVKKFNKGKRPQINSRMLALAAHALADVSFGYE